MILSSLTHAKSNGSSLFAILSLDILQSLDEDKLEALRSININSIGDLLYCRFFHTAQVLMAISRKEIGHNISLEKLLNDKYVNKKPSELPDLPLIAIEGIGEVTAKVFNASFGITTVRELAIFPPFIESQEYLIPDTEVFNESASAPEDLMPKIVGSTHSIARFNQYIKDEELKLNLGLVSKAQEGKSRDINQELYDIFITSNARMFLGYIAGFKQKWVNMGTHLGEIVHSLALAPGESRNIAIIEWYRRQSSNRDEKTIVDEKLTNNLVHSRALNEVVKSTAREHLYGKTNIKSSTKTSGFGITAGAGGGASSGTSASGDLTSIAGFPLKVASSILSSFAGSAGISAVYSDNEQVGKIKSSSRGFREVLGDIQQNITDSTVQNASNIRSLYSTVVVTDTQAEKEDIQTRNVTNYNHSHALTIQYYEVLQKYNIVMELESWQPVVYLPFKPIQFTMPVIQKYWHLFSKFFANAFPEMYEGFNYQIKKYKAKPEGFDYTGELSVLEIRINTSNGAFPNYTFKRFQNDENIMVEDGLYLHIKPEGFGFKHPIFKSSSIFNINKLIKEKGISDKGLMISDFASLEFLWDPNYSKNSIEKPISNDRGNVQIFLEIDLIDIHGKKFTAQKSYYKEFTFNDLFENYKNSIPIIVSNSLASDIKFILDEISGQNMIEVSQEIEKHFNQHKYGYTRFLLNNIEIDQLIDIVESLTFANTENKGINIGKPLPLPEEKEKELVDYLHPLPIAITENYLIFEPKKLKESEKGDLIWSYLTSLNSDLVAYKNDRSTKVQDTVFLPTAGVFAEAILGRSNASEILDPRRFWNWQDSPIPNSAPQLAAIEAGKHTVINMGQSLDPNAPASTLNIITPPQFPMPTSLNAALQAVQNGNMFRDMSKTGELVTVLGNLANLANSTAQLAGNLSGEAAENALNGAIELGKQVAGMVNKATEAWDGLNIPTSTAYVPENHTQVQAGKNRKEIKPPSKKEPPTPNPTPKEPGDEAKLIDVHCVMSTSIPTEAWVFNFIGDFGWEDLFKAIVVNPLNFQEDLLLNAVRSFIGFNGSSIQSDDEKAIDNLATLEVKFKVNVQTLQITNLEKKINFSQPQIFWSIELDKDTKYPAWGRQIPQGVKRWDVHIPKESGEKIYEEIFTPSGGKREVQFIFNEIKPYFPDSLVNKMINDSPLEAELELPLPIPLPIGLKPKIKLSLSKLIEAIINSKLPGIYAKFNIQIKKGPEPNTLVLVPICTHDSFPEFYLRINDELAYEYKCSNNSLPNNMETSRQIKEMIGKPIVLKK